jgi:hypothetical protein
VDLCPTVFDPVRPLDQGAQADADGDGVGDACAPCPLAPDRAVCAGDLDGDGVGDGRDLCPFDAASSLSDRTATAGATPATRLPRRPEPRHGGLPRAAGDHRRTLGLGDGVTPRST